jgi:hypothetical protein
MRIKNSIEVKASKERIIDVIISYQLYSEWFPNILSSEVINAEPAVVLSRLSFDGFPGGECLLDSAHGDNEIKYTMYDQRDGSAIIRGNWTITTLTNGKGCMLTGTMDLQARSFISLIWWVMKGRTLQLRRLLTQFLKVFAKMATLKRLAVSWCPQDTGRKVFEIIQREDGIEVFLLGRYNTLHQTKKSER